MNYNDSMSAIEVVIARVHTYRHKSISEFAE